MRSQKQTGGIEKLGTNIETPNDVASSRSVNTEYQNTNSYNQIVKIVLGSDGSQEINVRLRTGMTAGSLIIQDEIILHAADISDATRLTVSAEVPPDGFYELQAGSTNEATIDDWVEIGRA